MATRKKKYPKLKMGTATASEILAAHKITPAEIRRARRIVDEAMRKLAAAEGAKKVRRAAAK